jgi:LysR family nod box-dependent transcriptional activator
MADLRRIDMNLIAVLDAILTEMNLTRAGEMVGMTQPAVSGALARLRQQFDDPLLIRVGRNFVLTEKAEALKPLVSEAMVEIARTFEIMPNFEPETSTRTFSIAASDYALSQMTSALLGLINEVAPNVNVDFVELPTDRSVSAVDLLRRDVIVSAVGVGIAGKHKSLFSDTFVCVADAKNERLVDGAFDIEDLKALRLARVTFGERAGTPVDVLLSEAGVVPKEAISVRGFLPIPFAVANSNMIGFIPERVAKQYGPALGLVVAKTPLPTLTLIEAVHWHPSKSEDPAIKWLISMLLKTAEIIDIEEETIN